MHVRFNYRFFLLNDKRLYKIYYVVVILWHFNSTNQIDRAIPKKWVINLTQV